MELQQQFEGDVTFIGVPEPANDVSSASEFVEGTGSDFLTHLHDVDGSVWSTFGVVSRQTFIVIEADGTVTEVDFNDLGASVEALAAA